MSDIVNTVETKVETKVKVIENAVTNEVKKVEQSVKTKEKEAFNATKEESLVIKSWFGRLWARIRGWF